MVIISRGSAPAEHWILFIRFIHLASQQSSILIGLEVGKTYYDMMRVEGGADLGYPVGQIIDIEISLVVPTSSLFFYLSFQDGWQVLIVEKSHGMYSYI